MNKFCIEILREPGISSSFIRANSWVIDQYANLLDDHDDIKNKILLEKIWLKDFNAVLIYDHDVKSYAKIAFNTVQDMTIFLVKWG
jgi:hypothetical protein